MDVAPNAAAGTAGLETGPKSEHRPHGHEPAGKSGHAQSFLALTALGVVFGDIGTSPLYAFSVALNATGQTPAAAEVLGIVSLTFWALMAIISLKYVVFVLRADNEGEGGILALLSLVEPHDGTARRAKLSFVVLHGVVGAALLYGDGDLRALRHRGTEVQSERRELGRAGDTGHSGRTFCSSISWDRKRRAAVRAGHGRVVCRYRHPRHRQYLGGAGDPRGVQSARSGALCDRKPDHALHRVGRRIPGSDRR